MAAIAQSADESEHEIAAAKSRLAPILGMLDDLAVKLEASEGNHEIVKEDEELFLGSSYNVTYYARNNRSEALAFMITSGPTIGGKGKIAHSIQGLDTQGMKNILNATGQSDRVASIDVYGSYAMREITFTSPREVELVAAEIERMLISYFRR